MAGIREPFEIVDRATKPLAAITDKFGQCYQSITYVNSELDRFAGLGSLAGRVLGMLGGAALVRGAIALSDELSLTETRLRNVNDGLQTTAELQDMIYNAAQRSRGSYQDMAQMVASLKAQTGDTFSSVREAA